MIVRRYQPGTEHEGVLRISIDGRWSVSDFSTFFSRIEVLNELAHFGQISVDGQTSLGVFRSRYASWFRYEPFWSDAEFEMFLEGKAEEETVRDFIREVATPEPLRVRQVQFASPGHTDLGGIGKVIEQIRLFVMAIVERYDAKPDRALAREEKHQTIIAKKMANAEKLLGLAKKMGLDHQTRNMMVRQALELDRYVENQTLDGRITSIEDKS